MFFTTFLSLLWLAKLLALPAVIEETPRAPDSAETAMLKNVSLKSQQASEVRNCTLRGKVVNSVTGEPIRNALVQVSIGTTRSALTLADGSFQIAGLPAGDMPITIRKPGFFSEQEIQPLARGQFTAALGPDSPPVALKLVPEAVIFGTIKDEYSEPLEGMNVRLTRISMGSGHKSREQQGTTETDETGSFRFAELLPGTYYLSVRQGADLLARFRLRTLLPRTSGYPTEFYPGVSEISSATPIKMVPGKRMQIDMSLAAKPLFRVGGTVSGYAEGQRVALQITDPAGEALGLAPDFNPQTGRFQFAGLPPGTYTITARAADTLGRLALARKQVIVNADVANLHLFLAGTRTIPVNLRREFLNAPPPENLGQQLFPATITMIPDGDPSDGQPRAAGFGGDREHPRVEIGGVEPGTYAVQIEPTQGGYIYSAKYGAVDLLRDDITIDADAPVESIEVVVRDDAAALSGTLTSDGHRTHGAILLVLESAPRHLKLAPADSAGSFQFSQLAPGNYRIVGLDQIDDVEYRDQDFLRKYLQKGQEITLSPGQSAAIQLELVHVGD